MVFGVSRSKLFNRVIYEFNTSQSQQYAPQGRGRLANGQAGAIVLIIRYVVKRSVFRARQALHALPHVPGF